MTRYSKTPVQPETSAQARGSYLRVSFKNTQATAQTIKGMKLDKALKYFDEVNAHQRAVPLRKHSKSAGRTGQGKEWGVTKARWPAKSVKFLTDLLLNAKANADAKGLNTETLVISHIQVNNAPKGRRRTYRAHGRINQWNSNPCHIEVFLSEPVEEIPKATDKYPKHISSRQRGIILDAKRAAAAKSA